MAEGIFRLPGSVKRLRLLQTHFDTPSTYGSHLDWRGYTVHDAASILRRFINYLPEPVITTSYYRPFKDTMGKLREGGWEIGVTNTVLLLPLDQIFPSVNEKVKAFQALIEQLPLCHQYLLLYLLDLLAIFVTTASFTKMDVDCLAAVFAPVKKECQAIDMKSWLYKLGHPGASWRQTEPFELQTLSKGHPFPYR